MTNEEAIRIAQGLITDFKCESETMVEFCNVVIKALKQEPILDKIRAEITDCLKALDEIEKSGFNIYLPNEISGRRLTYQQCLEFINKYSKEKK